VFHDETPCVMRTGSAKPPAEPLPRHRDRVIRVNAALIRDATNRLTNVSTIP
jgi:hypothetical protein